MRREKAAIALLLILIFYLFLESMGLAHLDHGYERGYPTQPIFTDSIIVSGTSIYPGPVKFTNLSTVEEMSEN